jgi:hypothetical protein
MKIVQHSLTDGQNEHRIIVFEGFIQTCHAFSLAFLLEMCLRCSSIILKYNIQAWMGE